MNATLLQLWWRITQTILERQSEQELGTGALDPLATDLRAELRAMERFSSGPVLHTQLRGSPTRRELNCPTTRWTNSSGQHLRRWKAAKDVALGPEPPRSNRSPARPLRSQM